MSVIVVGLALASAGVRGNEKAPAKAGQEEIDKLIDQLKSDQFKVREEATRRLMERDDALPTLQRTAKSDDAEVAGRARKAIEAINKRLAKRALRRAAAMLKKGQTDLFVEQVVTWREYMDEDCWKAAVEHVEAIAAEASKVSGGQYKLTRKLHKDQPPLPWLDITKLAFSYDGHYRGTNKIIKTERIAAESISVREGFVSGTFLICRGAIESQYQMVWSVLFANGSVKANLIGECIVVCDGDVTATAGDVNHCVILATGDVKVGAGIVDSVVISGGNVKFGLKFPKASVKNSVIQERQQDPLNLIHFFDPAQAGIEVKTTKEGVQVEALAAVKSFAQAGARKGDRIVAVDGVKVDSALAFRRLLRQRVQASKPLLLEMRREDKPLHIEVQGVGVTP